MIVKMKKFTFLVTNKEYQSFIDSLRELGMVHIQQLQQGASSEELQAAIRRGAIEILDDATIAAMKAKRARDKARDEAQRQKEAIAEGEQTDWQEAMRQWEEWEKGEASGQKE